MAERKVQSKHIPADYDHRVLKHLKGKEPKQRKSAGQAKETVRLMLPFNVCCAKCNQYMYRGRKFNAKKEVSSDNAYLGTKQLLFHVKCEHCSNPIVFRTDPESSGFAMVSGARENKTSEGRFNPLAGVVEKDDEAQQQDAMAALEARATETRLEMEKITELTLEMQRSAQREQRLKRGMVLEDENDQAPTLEEEEMLERFRAERLAKVHAGGSAFNNVPAATALVADVSNNNTDGEEDKPMFQRHKKAKPAALSFVSYASSSSDDDE
ncbi:hypothetical protein BASA81_001170 [Batrachochytrium salamandrivorans]|nr:hypothetical protein BASA81_001170 [Batrachochytrium salamandrivorans]